eukprot:763246-Hanusia_phi.AAC.1
MIHKNINFFVEFFDRFDDKASKIAICDVKMTIIIFCNSLWDYLFNILCNETGLYSILVCPEKRCYTTSCIDLIFKTGRTDNL